MRRRPSTVSRPRCSRTDASSVPSSRTSRPGRAARRLARRTGRRTGRAGGAAVEHRHQVVGVGGQRRTAGRTPDRLGHPARRPGREDRATPHERQRVGQREREVLGRVVGDVAMRRARDGDVVEDPRDALGSTSGPTPRRCSACSMTTATARVSSVWVGSIVLCRPAACSASTERGGQAVISMQPRRTASRTADAVCASPPAGREHDDEVERAGPAGQARVRARRRTAPDDQGSSTARSSRASAPAATTARGGHSGSRAGERLGRPRRPRAGPAHRPRRAGAAAASAASSASGSSRRASSNTVGHGSVVGRDRPPARAVRRLRAGAPRRRA